VPYTTFDVADGVLIIAVGNDLQFRAFCTEMGVPEVGADPRFALARDRLANREAIEAIVADLVKDQTRDALIARLEAAGVPVGPVNTLEDVFGDPFVEARGTLHKFVREDGVEIPSVAYPGKLSRTPAQFDRRPPRVGEHGRELLAEWLGMDEAEFTALAAAGAVKG
jgi:crotonobetainyl-CoA:carnitine CoA-transferase CaiB-like acyl-CoA transferase